MIRIGVVCLPAAVCVCFIVSRGTSAGLIFDEQVFVAFICVWDGHCISWNPEKCIWFLIYFQTGPEIYHHTISSHHSGRAQLGFHWLPWRRECKTVSSANLTQQLFSSATVDDKKQWRQDSPGREAVFESLTEDMCSQNAAAVCFLKSLKSIKSDLVEWNERIKFQSKYEATANKSYTEK